MTANRYRTGVRPIATAALLALLALASPSRARANPITFSSTAVAPLWFNPADDDVSFAGVASTVSSGGRVTFQSGSFFVGNSPIADQNILFSFVTAVTINGNTENVTISGEDQVTSAADTLLIFAGAPVYFGDLKFTLDASSTVGASVNTTLPVALSADITQTPEPAGLVLLGTGALGFASFKRRQPTV